ERTLSTHRDHAVGLRHVLVIDLGDRATGGRVREDPGVREVDRRADPRPIHVERGGPAAVDPSGLDDAAAVRQHARVVDGEPQLAVRGHRGGAGRREAADGREGLAAAARLRPDVVLLDIRLPDVDGYEVSRRLVDSSGRPAVVLVSTLDAVDVGPRAVASGARGFVTKSRLSGDTLRRLLNEEEGA